MLPSASAAPLGIDSASTPRLPDQTSGGGPLDFFLLTISVRDLAVDADGYLLAVPCKLLVRPGLHGVEERRGKVSHDHAILLHQREGRVVVPDDFPCRAFGEPRPAEVRDERGIMRPTCTYRVQHRPTEGGPQYHDAWQRYSDDGAGGWILDVDPEGYMAFLRDLAAWLDPQPHHLRLLIERLHHEGRSISVSDLRIFGREPEPTPAPAPKCAKG